MGDSPGHVEAPRGRPQGRLRSVVRHRRGHPVPHQSEATSTGCCAGTGRTGSTAWSPGRAGRAASPQAVPDDGAGPDHRPAGEGSAERAGSTPGLPRSPGTSGARPCPSRRPRPSAGSSTPRASSSPSRTSGPGTPGSGSRPPAPNEVWQSDFTHWRLADGSGVEICSPGSTTTPATCSAARCSGGWTATTWSRPSPPPATSTAGPPPRSPTTGPCTPRAWSAAATASSTCSRTSASARRTATRGNPQTQGKIEHFHQTLKRWLGRQPAAGDLGALQAQLDAFREVYNEQRPHRAIGRRTPGEAYRASPKALPSAPVSRDRFRLPVRHHRQEGCDQPAAPRTDAPPADRRGPRRPPGPGHRR